LPSTIEKVTQQHRGQPLAVLAVNLQESREAVAAWVKSRGTTVRVLLDPDGEVTSAFRVRATPTVVLIGRDGRMVARASGTRSWADETGRALFRALLAAPGR